MWHAGRRKGLEQGAGPRVPVRPEITTVPGRERRHINAVDISSQMRKRR